MRFYRLPLTWEPMPSESATAALAHVLSKWEGTPYMPGQASPGVGVDCVRFLCEVFRELRGLDQIPLPKIPPDASLHDPKKASKAMRTILTGFLPWTKVTNRRVQPGDVLAVSYDGGGPGHGMLVGTQKNTLYHADVDGVVRTGFGLVVGQQKVHSIYRLDGREAWSCS